MARIVRQNRHSPQWRRPVALVSFSLVALLLTGTTSFAFTTPTASQGIVHGTNKKNIRLTALDGKAEIPGPTRNADKLICSFDETDFSGRTSWPYTAADLNRLDNTDDSKFYDSPRMVTHIDDMAIESLTEFYKNTFEELAEQSDEEATKKTIDILDLCSSWVSHLPVVDATSSFQYGNVVGLGMNQEELNANPQLTSSILQNLNIDPKLSSLDDESFDVVAMTVSIDYLIKPLEVIQEIKRVLKPNGVALISFGDRCFPTKAVAMWLQADPIDRITIVASYFHYAQYDQEANKEGGDDSNDGKDEVLYKWKSIDAYDLKDEPQEAPPKPSMGEIMSNPALGFAWMNTASAVQKANNCDPLFVIKASK
ncbi:unnamed protein product [Pseudo-nitzschia multistriata]|uniref:Methyltransferase type 11 domain-containing protein n=1 Tax=Pseudo-nitzschia multistriata TaxID=183589 RepID=A0A448ZIR4_9STRA|nr:unnamed protein product [Pseudo-nitzschia multistriata]